MFFVVLFDDNPNAAHDLRGRHMPAHLAFLEMHAAQIKAAGPLQTPSNDAAGGLWIVDAAGPEAVDALVKQDPFWPTGLRGSVRILRWFQVFANGNRLV